MYIRMFIKITVRSLIFDLTVYLKKHPDVNPDASGYMRNLLRIINFPSTFFRLLRARVRVKVLLLLHR